MTRRLSERGASPGAVTAIATESRSVPRRHADHRAAIAAASSATRKLITAAGGIMIAVFLGFATDPYPVIKMTGIGLATGCSSTSRSSGCSWHRRH